METPAADGGAVYWQRDLPACLPCEFTILNFPGGTCVCDFLPYTSTNISDLNVLSWKIFFF